MAEQIVTITTKIDIPFERISDLLTGAIEGGSNYWYWIEEKIAPKKWDFTKKILFAQDYPLNPDGALIISSLLDPDYPHVKLDLKCLQKGLQIMSEKYPEQFLNFVQENDDANTADCFLQCCCFGEEIYG